MKRGIRDEYVSSLLHDAVRSDYANSPLSVSEIARKHGVSIRSVFSWSKGIKRNEKRENKFVSMRFTETDLEDIILAIMEAEKSAKGNMLIRYDILEDRFASKAEELYMRRNHNE